MGNSNQGSTNKLRLVVNKDLLSISNLVEKRRWEAVMQLIREKPQIGSDMFDESTRQLCCHQAMIHDVPSNVLDLLLSSSPAALSVADAYGKYPVHYAVAHCSDLRSALEVINRHDDHQDALLRADIEGNLPLHLALSSYKLDTEAVKFLIEVAPESVKAKNKQG
jgi:ankyrin repeat protein